jgi:VCBS repeat-containing protein
LSGLATVRLTVNPINDLPVAVDNAYTVGEDASLHALEPGILANDQDVDGDRLTAQLVENVANGLLQFNSDGSFLYTPRANFHGTDRFTYRVHDGQALSANVAAVTITVTPRADAPIANDDFGSTTPEETPITINVLANDTDADGDSLSIVQVQSIIGGTAAANPDGTITFTPDENFFGTANFSYAITDGTSLFDSATVVVSVINTNDEPVANPDSATTIEDVPVLIAILANDTDADGDGLRVQSVGSALHGNVRIEADGRVTYTPNANFHGSDSFSYAVADGNGGNSTARVSVTIHSINDAPVAGDDAVSTKEDSPVVIPVLANDSDVEGSPLAVSLVSGAAHGMLAINADGITYTPNANFHGSDSFAYRVNDGSLDSEIATVSITVQSVNDGPVAEDDVATTDEDVPVVVAVLSNDSDLDGDVLLVTLADQPANGTATVNPNGTVTYVPNANFNGSDSFTYQINDGQGGLDLASVSITMRPDADLGLPILDVVPTDPNNAISSSSKFDVAILSTGEFDATTRIIVSSLTFGRTGDEDSLVRHKKTGAIQFRYQDVNGDGRLDLVVTVDGKKTGLSTGDTQAFLKADDANGAEYVLADKVNVASRGGNKGNGKSGRSSTNHHDALFASLSDEDEDWPF